MYLDIEANANVAEPTMRTFKETAPSAPVRAVRLNLDGGAQWCAVVGWSEAGPCAALLTPIEESGDGPARLLHGGDQGVRFARITDPSQAPAVRWSIDDSRQWGEPFLLLRPDATYSS